MIISWWIIWSIFLPCCILCKCFKCMHGTFQATHDMLNFLIIFSMDYDVFLFLSDLKSKKKFNFFYHTHIEFTLHYLREFLENGFVNNTKYNDIYINMYYNKIFVVFICKQSGVNLSPFKFIFQKKIVESIIPSSKSLFKTIYSSIHELKPCQVYDIFIFKMQFKYKYILNPQF